jgi:hypothetical protein
MLSQRHTTTRSRPTRSIEPSAPWIRATIRPTLAPNDGPHDRQANATGGFTVAATVDGFIHILEMDRAFVQASGRRPRRRITARD